MLLLLSQSPRSLASDPMEITFGHILGCDTTSSIYGKGGENRGIDQPNLNSAAQTSS